MNLDAFASSARCAPAATHAARALATGRLLRLVFDLRLYRWLGFETGARYVREARDLDRTAQGLIAVDRVTARSPQNRRCVRSRRNLVAARADDRAGRERNPRGGVAVEP